MIVLRGCKADHVSREQIRAFLYATLIVLSYHNRAPTLPLVVSISLVYAASRYESWRRIWAKALSLCTMILALMALTTIILLLINTQV